MKPAPFAYRKARSLDEVIALLTEHGENARLLAGGQSLLATLNMRLSAPKLLVDINAIDGLDRVVRKDGQLEIGALVRHATAERAREISELAPLIARALPHIAHPAIRNRGTIGGSIAFADPAAELPACLLALGGEVELTGANGRRAVKADEFFKGLYQTAIAPAEVLTAIRVPAATAKSRCGFAEFARRHGDYAMVGLATSAQVESKRIAEVRLAYFGVGATPLRAKNAEAALVNGSVEDAIAALARDLDPPDDVHASGRLKKHLAGVLLRRVAHELVEQP
ncbi:MAG TPA: xanthine dehydrogenase family protein subunit M [Xanthobacteraceae bacterium]|nr:xanthine dehydrogenase family protein subunit M [Xanthobacteraceae bacterium]